MGERPQHARRIGIDLRQGIAFDRGLGEARQPPSIDSDRSGSRLLSLHGLDELADAANRVLQGVQDAGCALIAPAPLRDVVLQQLSRASRR